MRKLLAVLIEVALLLTLASCGGNSNDKYFPDGFEAMEGEFSVTPDSFIAAWNTFIGDLQEQNPNDLDIQNVLPLPDFVSSGSEEKIGSHFDVEYLSSDSGNLSSVKITMYATAGKVEQNTFGFMLGALPALLNPGTTILLADELNLSTTQGGVSSCYDGNIEYQYIVVGTGAMSAYAFYILPKW